MSINEPQAGEIGKRSIHWPRVHDRYRIVRELGAGAFGKVFLAEDEQTSQRVAVRVLPLAASAVPNIARIIQSTSRSIMAAPTSHPSLTRVLEVGRVEPGQISVVTELVEGRRLSEILAAGKPLEFGTSRRWVLDLGGAIEVLHNLGRVHGALRHRNVMLLADGSVKLMDIELAGLREMAALRDGNAPAEYMAPEQVNGGLWTEKTDSYAFGLLVYDVFCGGPPFQGSSREAVLAKQLSEAPAPMRRRRPVPASVESIVTQALEKDPDLRPWMDELLNGLWGETSMPTTANGTKSGSVGWKRPALFAGSAVAAAAAIVLAIWGLSGLESSSSSQRPTASVPAEQAPVSPRTPPASQPTRSESAARSAAPTASPQAVAPPAAPAIAPPPGPPAPIVAAAPPAKPNVPAAETRPAPSPAALAARPTPRPAAVAPGADSGSTAVAEPQAEKRTYRVGWLDPGRVSPPYQDIVRQSLVGYPRDIAFEYRYAGGRVDRLPE